MVMLISFALFAVEPIQSEHFGSYSSSLWYSLKQIGFGNEDPQTLSGRIFAVFLKLANLAIFSIFISLVVTKIGGIMDTLASGKIGKITLKNHIVVCGNSTSSLRVINDLLEDPNNYNNVILISETPLNEEIAGLIYLNGDSTKLNILEKANIKEAAFAVVFAEQKKNDSLRDVDSILTNSINDISY